MKKNIKTCFLMLLLGIVLAFSGTNMRQKVFAENVIIPLVDYENTIKFDDFNFNQDIIFENKENKLSQSLLEKSKIQYRISNHNSNLLKVAEGKLVFNADNLNDNDYINFETQTSYEIKNKKFMIVKISKNTEASLSNLSFCLDSSNFILFNDLKMTNSLGVLDANESNPYYDSLTGYYYLVIDIVESGLCLENANLNTLAINYNGKGRVYIDEIFYANELESMVLKEEKMTSSIFSLTSEQVEFFGYFSNEIQFANFNQMSFDITLTDMEKDINSLIVEVDNTKYYANPSDENRKIILTEEKLFSDLNFEENSTQHITLDLFKMGIKKGRNFRFYADFNQTGVMSLSNITLSNILTAETSLFLNNYLVKDVLVQNFTPTTNSNFLGEITFDNSQILTSNIFGFDLYGQNIDISKLVLKSGSTILNLNTNSTSVINDNETVLLYIDLKNYNVQEIKNNGIQVYYDFLDSSKINISNVMLANLENKYQYIVNQFEVFEEIDNVSPKVEIYNSPSFELTSVSSLFIVDFDADANDNGDVETVQIILTGPNGDVQYGDSQNKSFRVSEGTYQLKILATDYNKNVGEATATILVTDNVPNVNPDNPNQSGNTGIGNTDTKDEVEAKSKVWLIVLIVVISLLVASGITVGIIFFIKRKNNFGNFKLK